MTSERKIAANRRNGRRGRGPRTAAGKSSSSRNALRHGLSTVGRHNPSHHDDIERIARQICGEDDDPELLEFARAIAEKDLLWRCVCAERVAAVERLRNVDAVPVAKRASLFAEAKARGEDFLLADAELAPLKEWLFNGQKGPRPVPQPLNGAPARIWRPPDERPQRDEFEATLAAEPDLLRIKRYERRAWSGHKRAIRDFIEFRFRRNAR